MEEPDLIAGDVGVGFHVPDRGHAEGNIGWIRAGSDESYPSARSPAIFNVGPPYALDVLFRRAGPPSGIR